MLPHSLILPLACYDSTDRQVENNFITACFYPNGILIKIVANSPGNWSTVRQTQAEDMRLADVNWRRSQLDGVWKSNQMSDVWLVIIQKGKNLD